MLMPRLDCVVEERSIDRRGRLLTYRTSQVPHQKNLTKDLTKLIAAD